MVASVRLTVDIYSFNILWFNVVKKEVRVRKTEVGVVHIFWHVLFINYLIHNDAFPYQKLSVLILCKRP